MDTTFDINKVDDERLQEPASYGQIRAISFKFSKNQPAKKKWSYQ